MNGRGGRLNNHEDYLIDPLTGDFVKRQDNLPTTKKNLSYFLNISFVISLALALVLPAIASSYLGIAVHKVASDSMVPAMNSGDMFLSKITTASVVKNGDVILLLNPDTWQIQSHRVIQKINKGKTVEIITKGDANIQADKPYVIGSDTAVRRAIAVVPNFGYVLNALVSWQAKIIGLALLLATSIAIVTTLAIRRRKSDLI